MVVPNLHGTTGTHVSVSMDGGSGDRCRGRLPLNTRVPLACAISAERC